MATTKATTTTEIVERKQTPSERFAVAVERQFAGEVGAINLTPYEKSLAQHLFIKVDAALAEAESKRFKDGALPFTWENVDMRNLALAAVNRVQLGIDALIPGHLYPIAYFNSKTKKYDIDLRVGYKGELYYKIKASAKEIKNVRVELVYDTDIFTVYKAGLKQAIEGYDFEITKPFERGELVGGFGYIEYADNTDNVLVTLSKAEIDKFKGKAAGDKFWGEWYEQMAYKTIVHRLMGKITIDPERINTLAMVQADATFDAPYERGEELPPIPENPVPLSIPEDADMPATGAEEGGEPY